MKIGVLIGGFVIFMGAIGLMIFKSEQRHEDQSVACANKGGYYVRARDMTPICIKKEVLVEVKNG